MKKILLTLLLLAAVHHSPAANPPAPVRTIKDLPRFPMDALRHSIDHQLFRSLQVSPLEAWVVAKSLVFGSKLQNPKIIHEEAGGTYDKMLQDIARTYTVTGGEHTESRSESESLTCHLLIFPIKDGKMAIVLPYTDDARYVGFQQYGDTWIGILKNGTWTTVSKPQSHRR